jgi:hypothetical protein
MKRKEKFNLGCSPVIDKSISLKNHSCMIPSFIKSKAQTILKKEEFEKMNLKKMKEVILDKYRKEYACDNEKDCSVKVPELKVFYKPRKPLEWNKKKNAWLSTTDIKRVLQQYDSEYIKGPDVVNHHFKLLDVSPNDYDFKVSNNSYVSNGIMNLFKDNYLQNLLEKKIYNLGVVFNLDNHDQGGSHWTALFINLQKNSKKFGIWYFDAGGSSPNRNVIKLMFRIHLLVKRVMNTFIKIHINHIQKQFGNNECGIFATYFIINMLKKNMTFEKLIKTKFDDKDMNKHRDIFYNKI